MHSGGADDPKEAKLYCSDLPVRPVPGCSHLLRLALEKVGVRAAANGPPAMTQKLARHSDINLTLGTYTHLHIEELLQAVEKLPVLNPAYLLDSSTNQSVTPEPGNDPRLRGVIKVWEQLPEEIQQAIVTLTAIGIQGGETES